MERKFFEPYPYQAYAIQWILDHPFCGLFLEMGLGKTVITLSAIKRLIDAGEVHKVLVVAPLRVAETVWPEEMQKWEHLTGLRCSRVLGDEDHRKAALKDRDADVYVVNRENVYWLTERLKKDWFFDMLVLDELSSFKSAKSIRFRCLKKLRGTFARIVGLTGTPAPNGLIDLWSQMYLLDGGQRLGRSLGGYRERYFYAGRRNGNIVYEWVPRPESFAAIYSKLSDICMSMQSQDYLDLPDVQYIRRTCRVEGIGRLIYDKMERDLLVDVEPYKITAASAAVLAGKLMQMANGAVYTEDGKWQEIHRGKLNQLEDIIETAGEDQPILVYYAYQHDLGRLQKAFPGAHVLKSAEDVTAWNEGRYKLMLAHPDSAGHGLNLQRGGHIIVWFGLTWSLEKFQQANARLHRQGQVVPVQIYLLVAEDTIDEQVLTVLRKKGHTQTSLIEAVRARCPGQKRT